MPECVIVNSRHADFSIERSVLEPLGVKVITVAKELNEEELIHSAEAADALLVNLSRVSKRVIDALPRLKVISRYGVGLDSIDTEYARERNITVFNVPDYCTAEVAEHTLALMLALVRGIPARSQGVKNGKWDIPEPQYTLQGQVIGIIGYGSIAQAVILRCLAFMPKAILIYSRHVSKEHYSKFSAPPDGVKTKQVYDLQSIPEDPVVNLAQHLSVQVSFVSLDKLLAESTIISLHTNLSQENVHILDAHAFAKMQPGVYIVNTARGGLIDFEALFQAIQAGIVRGAGLDVFENEPPHKLLNRLTSEQFILSDHTAFRSVSSLHELKRRCAENAAHGLGLL